MLNLFIRNCLCCHINCRAFCEGTVKSREEIYQFARKKITTLNRYLIYNIYFQQYAQEDT
jgi:hypothetical protein